MAQRGTPRRLRAAVRRYVPELVELRRELHRHPELSWQEERTQGVVLERLKAWGLEDARPIARTGATALVKGEGRRARRRGTRGKGRGTRGGPTLLWRADMDALPVQEENESEYRSTVANVMHACGHDGHMAIALTLARVVHEGRSELPGNVRFVFQPAEETAGGARSCIDDGVMDKPKVDAVLGLHIDADTPVGALNVLPGPVWAAPTGFRLVITGRSGHGGLPQQTVDAIAVAAQVISALQTVVSRSMNPQRAVVLTVGTIQGGTKGNIIAGEVDMTGTIRTFEERTLERVLRRAEEIVRGVTSGMGAEYRFEHVTPCPPAVNDEGMAGLVREVGAEFFGAERLVGTRTTGADDMAMFLAKAPGCYFRLGGRNEERDIRYPHHHPRFDFDEEALGLGVEFGLRLIEAYLGRGGVS
ncbi:MAG: amidohydrolase [Dehalococcoidia bacterium]